MTHHWIGEIPDPDNYFGFIYIIECLVSNKKYIGKKQYWSSRSGVAGCKSKTTDKASSKWKDICWKENDWKTYTGSSKEFNKYISDTGRDNFTFTILSQHQTKGALHYAEIEAQVINDVLRAKDDNGEYIFFNKQIAAIKFRPPDEVSEETRKKMSGENNPNFGRVGEKHPMFGKTHTDRAKQKISARSSGKNSPMYNPTVYHFIHKNGDEFKGTYYELYSTYNLCCKNLHKLINRQIKTSEGWKLYGDTSTFRECKKDTTVYTFVGKGGEVFKGTKEDIISVHGLRRDGVSRLVSGEQKTCKGWSISTDTLPKKWSE